MHHLYLSIHNNATALQQEREALVAWCAENGVKDYNFIADNLTGNIRPAMVEALLAPIGQGDTVVAYDIADLGRSLLMLLQVMEHLLANHCTLVTLADARTLSPNRTMTLFVNHLRDIVAIESRMKTSRLCTVMRAKRASGVTLGRPRGSRKDPAKSVLHGKELQLQSLLSQGLSDHQIATTLGVSHNTIRTYRLEHNLVRSK